MLELRPSCEHCNKPLPPNSAEVCANCGGGFAPRPIRPATNWRGDNFLGKDSASTVVKHSPVDAAAHARFSAEIKRLPPEQR